MFKLISYQGKVYLNHNEIHNTPIRMAKIKNPTNPSSGENAKQLEWSYIASRNAN